jgi:UDP-N-acetyl-D-mannosaminuronate dehydrogenase
MDTKQNLLKKINDRSARIAILGQGYVGLPLAMVLCDGG